MHALLLVTYVEHVVGSSAHRIKWADWSRLFIQFQDEQAITICHAESEISFESFVGIDVILYA